MDNKTSHAACAAVLVLGSITFAQVGYPESVYQPNEVVLPAQFVPGEQIVWDGDWEIQSAAEVILSERIISETPILPLPTGTNTVSHYEVLNVAQEIDPTTTTTNPNTSAPSQPNAENKQLQALNNKIDAAVEKLLAANKDPSDYETHLKSIKDQHKAIKTLMEKREATLKEIEKTLAVQVETSKSNATNINELRAQVDRLAKRAPETASDAIQKQLAEIKKEMGGLATQWKRSQDLLKVRAKEMSAKRDQQESKSRDTMKLNKALNELLSRLDRTQDRLDRVAAKTTELEQRAEQENHESDQSRDRSHDLDAKPLTDGHSAATDSSAAKAKTAKAMKNAASRKLDDTTTQSDGSKFTATKDGSVEENAGKKTTFDHARDEDIDPLRRRLDEIKQRLKSAKRSNE